MLLKNIKYLMNNDISKNNAVFTISGKDLGEIYTKSRHFDELG